VDLQRIEEGKVVFDFPTNPLLVPQMCLRFSDIGNVGITGRHYTSFCMIGQHALANSKGYWKDRCIDLDFKLLTKVLGIRKEEVIFKEDVWLGPGAFGNSLEYYVRGLELGNAVFTGFEGTPGNFKEYSQKVVDMGAGLERFVWLSHGTPTSYEAVFASPLAKLLEAMGVSLSKDETKLLLSYFRLAGSLDIDKTSRNSSESVLLDQVAPNDSRFRNILSTLRAIYSILDHTRTLLFAISDGALPSNVGGGYNLRLVLRRAIDFSRQLGGRVSLYDVASWHVEQLKQMYPELAEHESEVQTIFEVEGKKYEITKERSSKVVESLIRRKERIGNDRLIELYDSEGITPEALLKAGLQTRVPPDFYARVTERHMSAMHDESSKQSFDIEGLRATKLIFYADRDRFESDSKILKILDGNYIVLDRTPFFARAGGQEPDHGTIDGFTVDDVIKFKDVVLHHLSDFNNDKLSQGMRVHCIVDSMRRSLIMRHHTATHVVNGACRKTIGSWVWQHSAFKDIDMARLDITHFAHLTREQVLEIERLANQVVRMNLQVKVTWIPRRQAEQAFGFRLYQGGVAPTKELRVVNIERWDIEACGGTHCSSTGEIGLIKITKSERVQDGVERLEFVAGEPAVKFIEKQETALIESASLLQTPVEKLSLTIANMKSKADSARRASKALARRLAESMTERIPSLSKEISPDVRLYIAEPIEGLDSEYHLSVGERLSKTDSTLVYVAFFQEAGKTRIIAFCGSNAQNKGVRAGQLVRELASSIGGSGGGDSRFGQGGVPSSEIRDAPDVEDIVRKMIAESEIRVGTKAQRS
jgi:alanyl-tRNA synthetase